MSYENDKNVPSKSDLPTNKHDGSLGGFRHKAESDLSGSTGNNSNFSEFNNPSGHSKTSSSGFDPSAAGIGRDGKPTFKTVSDPTDNGSGFKNNKDEGRAGRLTNQDNYTGSSSGQYANDNITSNPGVTSNYNNNNLTSAGAGMVGSSGTNEYADSYNTSGNPDALNSGTYIVQSTADNSAFDSANSGLANTSGLTSSSGLSGDNANSGSVYADAETISRGPQTRQVGAFP